MVPKFMVRPFKAYVLTVLKSLLLHTMLGGKGKGKAAATTIERVVAGTAIISPLWLTCHPQKNLPISVVKI